MDWDAGGGKVRIPVVGDDDRSPEGGPIANLAVVDGELRYHDNRFPIAPGTADDGADAATVHDRQHYELVNWRVADDGLNYRRFFAVNTLAAIRVEDPDVFAQSHVEIRRWFDEGLVDGLRVDHPDGVRDPEGYLEDLAGGDRRRLLPGREDPRARREAAGLVVHRGHHRVRRAGVHRPGAHRPGRRRLRWTRSRPGSAATRSTGTS